MNKRAEFEIGLEVGTMGRWFRLIVGLYLSLLVTLVPLAEDPVRASETLSFLGTVGLYFVAVLAVYLIAFYYLGERILAQTNPWFGTLIFLGPVVLVGVFNIGPQPFQVAVGLYYSISSIFNFAMSYGGCEVVAIPSLIFRKRYTLYCPYNAVDVVEKAILSGSPGNTAFGLLSFGILVFVGGYFLLVEDQNVMRHFFNINLPNEVVLLLLIPLAFIARNGWQAYEASDREWSSQVQTYAVGGLVLLVLSTMFIFGVNALWLWPPILLIGGLIGIARLVRSRREREGAGHQ